MRRFLPLCLIATVVALPPASASPVKRLGLGRGISVVLPDGWHLARSRVTTCTDPAQRFVATTTSHAKLHTGYRIPPRSALVLVMEGMNGRFPARPSTFTPPQRPGNLGGCCEIPNGPGVELIFHDHGRNFYAFVYLGDGASARVRQATVSLLSSLRVSVRR